MLLVIRQFFLLVWKGLVFRKRHFIVTIFETLIPLVLILFFVYLRTTTDSSGGEKNPARIFSEFEPVKNFYYFDDKYTRFYYTPDKPLAEKLTRIAFRKLLNTDPLPNITGFSSEAVLNAEALGVQLNQQVRNIYALVFENLDGDELPENLAYKIKINNDYHTSSKFQPFSGKGPSYADLIYTESRFLSIQSAVDQTFIELRAEILSKPKPNITVKMQKYAYPPYYNQSGYLLFFTFIPMIIIYGYSIMTTVFVKRIVVEKLNRAKEMMRMMGLNDFVYFSGTFCNTFFLMAAILTVTTILFKLPIAKGLGVISYADGFLVWILFMLYSVNALLFCMAISAFFNKPVVAAIVTYIVWSSSYSLPRFLMDPPGQERVYMNLALSAKLASSLLPNAAFHWAFKVMSFYETTSEGSDWSNMNTPAIGDNLSLAGIMGMMVLSSFIYAFILWYVDNVWPWQFGIPKNPLFIFMPSYWNPRKVSMSKHGNTDEINNPVDKTYFEEGPEDRIPGISISNLTKVFGWGSGRKVAVNDVSLNMFRGQITALLGHNGAGKTTTLNVITGLYAPTNGTALVNGCDILNNLKGARRSLGLCPQHNVLYENLTVEEHLTFFAGLKGRTFQEMKPEISSCLQLLQLENKRNDLAKTLSGGMKRKLSLGIAMIGGSEVLILDEPTSGMDPQARRAIWDLLQQIREERTIVLTTHYMEEADILGDRIAIMAEGAVQCCGSPLFLKRKFGAGYHLRISKGDKFNEQAMTSVIQESITDAYVDTDMRTEISYVLPVTDSQTFVPMFESLEQKKDHLGFTSCGLTITTMEDVFIKVGQLAEKAQEYPNGDHANENTETTSTTPPLFQVQPERRLRGVPLWFQQVRGLLTKRFHDSKRYWIFLIFLAFLPLALLFLMLYVRNSVDGISDNDLTPLKIDLGRVFGPTQALFSNDSSFGIENVKLYSKILMSAKALPIQTDNMTDSTIALGEESLNTYQNKLLVGGQLFGTKNDQNVIAMYSGEVNHVSAMSLNLMDTLLLRMITGNLDASITVTNAPLKRVETSDTSGIEIEVIDLITKLIFAFFLPLALSFLAASFVLFPIHERTTKSKLIQMMTGVDGVTFWVTHFLWDFAMYFISSCFMLIPFVAMDTKNAYSSGTGALGTLFMMLLLYGWSAIPLSYLMSFITKKASTGFSVASAINYLTGMILTLALTIYQLINNTSKGPNIAAWIFRILPNFAMTWGTANLNTIANKNVFCKNVDQNILENICSMNSSNNYYIKCCPDKCGDDCFVMSSYFTMDEKSCGRDMLFMFLSGLIFFSILAVAETNLIRFWYRLGINKNKQNLQEQQPISYMRQTSLQHGLGEDSDVASERSRVEQMYEAGRSSDEALMAYNLTKFFGNINAVDQLSFSVHKDECFGLLGVNGAGKTTTFAMLTGDLAIGQGDAHIGHYSVKDHLKEFQWHVGYCPQFDAILDRLTGQEALFLFARLRGVPEADIRSTVAKLIDVVDLQAYAHKIAETYSGGNRRKLSLAMSLVGSPPVVFLDEPTAGVDPASRRKIWNAFTQVQATGGTSFILTTHSMEECEALCGRLAIMVNGQFRCLGGIQYLKSKFGQGYTIIVKLNKEQYLNPMATESVKQFFAQVFPGSLLKDIHQGMLHYHIPDKTFSWSHLFREMERAKKIFTLEDYLISDTTLEQIFLAFAKTQRIVSSP